MRVQELESASPRKRNDLFADCSTVSDHTLFRGFQVFGENHNQGSAVLGARRQFGKIEPSLEMTIRKRAVLRPVIGKLPAKRLAVELFPSHRSLHMEIQRNQFCGRLTCLLLSKFFPNDVPCGILVFALSAGQESNANETSNRPRHV